LSYQEIIMTTRRRIMLILFCLLFALVSLAALYTWGALNWSYSDGDRAGFLQKFSKRGWICKTWEGELLLTSMPGAIPEKFQFTVRDNDIAKRLEQSLGKRVVLTYTQHKGVPSSCFGDSQYFVNKINVVPQP
jgi:hypothetical protein